MCDKRCLYHRLRLRPNRPRPLPHKPRPLPKPRSLRESGYSVRRPIRRGLAGLHHPNPPPVIGPEPFGPVPFKFGISSPSFLYKYQSLIYRRATLQHYTD